MALLALASAKGSPGVTTLAVALAGVHSRPAVVADLDPAGGDLALRYRDPEGHPLDIDRGLLSLGAATRRGALPVHEHLQLLSGGLPALAGVAAPEQITGLGPVWPYVADALRDLPGHDVFADCGRFSASSPTLPVLYAADAVILVARATVEHLFHLRERVRALNELLRVGGRGANLVGVILVAQERRRSVSRDVQKLVDAAGLSARVLGVVAEDAKGAAILEGRTRGAAGRTTLVRSVRSLAPAVLQLLAPTAQPIARA